MVTSTGKKWRLFRAWSGRRPVWCAWQVTYRCNFRCAFCHYWRDPMGVLPEQTVDDFRTGSRKLARFGSLLISLAGGEPLLRPDIAQIVRTIGEFHLPFITTNGFLATPDLARDLFASGLWGISVSLDYADPKRHDKARGTPGAFERAVLALDHFARVRRHDWQRVNVMCVLLHDNLDEVEPLIKLAAEHGAFFMLQLYGVRKTGSKHFVHANDGVSASRHLLDLKRRYPNFLSNQAFLRRFDEALTGGIPGCRAGQAFFNIDSCGDIAICVEERARPVANLYRQSAQQIHERLADRARGNACRACWYNCRGEVEMLYSPRGLLNSLPMLLDHGRPSRSNDE
jgi:MoaA/NifB/PqqE/SkfB family radical SAM enzyme